ncbi:hypothetical protein AbraIFM66950_000449, partial [Aspergillus brasiliensis]
MALAAAPVAIVVMGLPTVEQDVCPTAMRRQNVANTQVRCSEYGFCGTTKDFCSDGCQSNCVLNPKVPTSSSSNSSVLSKVIGYYEGWQATSTCHQTLPSDLPLAALTHVNFAFAYLTTDTYEITTMDSEMSTSLFTKVTDLKDQSSGLKVFVSIGGWSFSDNDTSTQPLFGDIAASATNRKTFAQNALKFMTTYGFDGIDIDWEYPGASDRGGKERDTENYVKLMKELRSVFDASGRTLEISFTLPSSYWYMRWFDIPGLLKYANWINLMSYDLHGTWDASDAIGNIVQGHTNLTDIKTAVELLWRVDTDPSKVVMGFGFYGRSFTLSDKSCSSPGCPFSSGGTAGSCTDTSGYLAYYEITDVLEKNSDITPVHDESAAVLYFTWGDGQWISYDNKTTFKQKVDWANNVGLGGAMIWASDQDTYSWSAHEALLGKTLKSNSQVALQTDSSLLKELSLKAVNKGLNQQCYRDTSCVDLRNPQVTCESGYSLVGYDKSKCRKAAKYYGMPICCATASKPSSCTWRGSGGDCDGQCHAGEVTLFTSSTGGGDYDGFKSESGTKKCSRGKKAFCCADNQFDDLTEDCYWTGCNGKCASGETSVATATNLYDKCTVFHHSMHYCCKTKPAPLTNCHWVGKGDCADNRCSSSEVTLATNGQGDSIWSCNWWRKKSLCCTPSTSAAAGCQDVDPCDLDPTLCTDYNDQYGTSLSKRDLLTDWWHYEEDVEYDNVYNETHLDLIARALMFEEEEEGEEEEGEGEEGEEMHMFEKRAAPRRDMPVKFFLDGIKKSVTMLSLSYPSNGDLFKGKRGKDVLQKAMVLASQSCGSPAMSAIDPNSASNCNTEHILDLQYIPQLLRTAANGILPTGKQMTSSMINQVDFIKYAMTSVVDLAKAGAISSGNAQIMNDRLFNAIGSTTNRLGLIRTASTVNLYKGRVFDFMTTKKYEYTGSTKSPVKDDLWTQVLDTAVKYGTSEAELLDPIRLTIAVW